MLPFIWKKGITLKSLQPTFPKRYVISCNIRPNLHAGQAFLGLDGICDHEIFFEFVRAGIDALRSFAVMAHFWRADDSGYLHSSLLRLGTTAC